jgi:hypothetical protein
METTAVMRSWIPSKRLIRAQALALPWAVLGTATGWLAWPSTPDLAILCLVSWLVAPSRFAAFVLAVGYFAAGSRGLPEGAGIFFSGVDSLPWAWTAVWLLAAMLQALPFALFWSRPWNRVWYVPGLWDRTWLIPGLSLTLLFLVEAVPYTGLGMFAWVSPFLSAGWFVPGAGFYGIVLIVAVLWIVAVVSDVQQVSPWYVIALAIAFVLIFNYRTPASAAPQDRGGVNTNLGPMPSSLMGYYRRLQTIASTALERVQTQPLTVFPETMTGKWYAGTAWTFHAVLESTAHNDHAALIGTEQPLPGRTLPYRDALVLLDHGRTRFLPDEIPVPIAMWHPWKANSALLDLWRPEVATIQGKRYGYLICYESLLLWPGLEIATHGPIHGLIFAANDWWARTTSIPAIEYAAAGSWARLMGVPMISAVNR